MSANTLTVRPQGLGEEIANAVSHWLGCALGIAGLILMLVQAIGERSGLAIVCAVVYGVSLIILYGVSGMYHSLPKSKIKAIFRVFDHCFDLSVDRGQLCAGGTFTGRRAYRLDIVRG